MKHLKPVTKAQSADAGSLLFTLLALLNALAPIIQWIIDSKPAEG
jgi:hypothetical protein